MNSNIDRQKEQDRFRQLCELTVALCGSREDVSSISKCRLKKWSDLASIWRSNPEDVGCENVFYPVLHHVHWGLYPDGHYSDEQLELFRLVEDGVLDSGSANRSWRKLTDFKNALDRFNGIPECSVQEGPGCRFCFSILYLWYRTLNLVQYKFTDFSTGGFSGRAQEKKYYLSVRQHCYAYEQRYGMFTLRAVKPRCVVVFWNAGFSSI